MGLAHISRPIGRDRIHELRAAVAHDIPLHSARPHLNGVSTIIAIPARTAPLTPTQLFPQPVRCIL
jgi:hypothetical protein